MPVMGKEVGVGVGCVKGTTISGSPDAWIFYCIDHIFILDVTCLPDQEGDAGPITFLTLCRFREAVQQAGEVRTNDLARVICS